MANIRHRLVSGIADDASAVAAGQVTPSNWNDTHLVTLTATDVPAHDNTQHSVAFVLPTDSRLTDARTPTTHGNGVHSSTFITSTDAVVPNTAITPGTKTKITFDAKGLVTAGADATAADVGAAATGAITTSGLTMGTGKLLGRGTAATGAVEEITLGTNLSLTGTTLNAAGGGSLSSTTPEMDGTATVGSEAAASHGDHVHPSDTTRLPLSGGKLTGNLSLGTGSAGTNATNTLVLTTGVVPTTQPTGTVQLLATATNKLSMYFGNAIVPNIFSYIGVSFTGWNVTGTTNYGKITLNSLGDFIFDGNGFTLSEYCAVAPVGIRQSERSATAAVKNFNVTPQDAKWNIANESGGSLLLNTGMSTGTGTNSVVLSTVASHGTGTTNYTATEKMRVDGAGVMTFSNESSNTAVRTTAVINPSWTTSTDATRTSKLSFSTVNSGTTGTAMELLGNGTPVFPALQVYADNTAALAGGLTAGMVYRTATGVLMVTY
jgi:hypothetical protein